MPNQQKVERFWFKLGKAAAELQHDFAELDSQDKQVIAERINNVLKLQGITVGVDSLLCAMGNRRAQNNWRNGF